MRIVDTDVLIDIQRGFLPAIEWIRGLNEVPSTTGFTVLELIQDARDGFEVQGALQLVQHLPVLWPDQTTCERAAQSFAKLHLSHRIGALDVLIAHTALDLDAELCTFNVKHFRAVPNLRLSQPYRR